MSIDQKVYKERSEYFSMCVYECVSMYTSVYDGNMFCYSHHCSLFYLFVFGLFPSSSYFYRLFLFDIFFFLISL